MALKEEGNRLFKEGDVKAARDLYTQSLSMYPLKAEDPASAKEYSVILANRDEERESSVINLCLKSFNLIVHQFEWLIC